MKTGANPQGKGLVPVLEGIEASLPASVEAKPVRKLLADYFTGMLVLSASFSFRPRPGVTYYLYLGETNWLLSLIAPAEWAGKEPGLYLGSCSLNRDMTWDLHARGDLAAQTTLVNALQDFHEGFVDLIDQPASLHSTLPFFAATLPYHQRLLATGMATSLSRSLALAGLSRTEGRQLLRVSPEHLLPIR